MVRRLRYVLSPVMSGRCCFQSGGSFCLFPFRFFDGPSSGSLIWGVWSFAPVSCLDSLVCHMGVKPYISSLLNCFFFLLALAPLLSNKIFVGGAQIPNPQPNNPIPLYPFPHPPHSISFPAAPLRTLNPSPPYPTGG